MLPGGVGVWVLMAAVMATAGVPAALSVPVIVMYRVINTIIQIPPGYYLYQSIWRVDVAEPVSVSVSELVGLLNQTLDYAYPSIEVTGELANLRTSRDRWVYFDLKDDTACVKFWHRLYAARAAGGRHVTARYSHAAAA